MFFRSSTGGAVGLRGYSWHPTLLLGDSEVLSGQAGSFLVLPQSLQAQRTRLEASEGKRPDQMPEPPPLAQLTADKQELYFKLPLGVSAPLQ